MLGVTVIPVPSVRWGYKDEKIFILNAVFSIQEPVVTGCCVESSAEASWMEQVLFIKYLLCAGCPNSIIRGLTWIWEIRELAPQELRDLLEWHRSQETLTWSWLWLQIRASYPAHSSEPVPRQQTRRSASGTESFQEISFLQKDLTFDYMKVSSSSSCCCLPHRVYFRDSLRPWVAAGGRSRQTQALKTKPAMPLQRCLDNLRARSLCFHFILACTVKIWNGIDLEFQISSNPSCSRKNFRWSESQSARYFFLI